MKYRVMLIDDAVETEPLQDFIASCNMAEIDIIPCKYHEDGMKLLKEDHSFSINAVILDATGYINEDDNELTNVGLKHSLRELEELQNKRVMPWFVFTGAPRNTSTTEFKREIEMYQRQYKFGRPDLTYYQKTIHEDELFEDIKNEIQRAKETAIEYKFNKVIKAARELALPEEDFKNLYFLLNATSKVDNLDPGVYFNQIRKFFEYALRGLNKLKILHDKCIDKKDQINLFESYAFLSGKECKHLKIKSNIPHLPEILGVNLKNLIHITGAASHTSEVQENSMNYQSYYNQLKTPYLLYQLLFTIADLYVWYGVYTKENSNIDKNRSHWRDIVDNTSGDYNLTGIVQQDSFGNYFVNQHLVSYKHIAEFGYASVGDEVIITKSDNNSNMKTNHLYPKFAVEIKKIVK